MTEPAPADVHVNSHALLTAVVHDEPSLFVTTTAPVGSRSGAGAGTDTSADTDKGVPTVANTDLSSNVTGIVSTLNATSSDEPRKLDTPRVGKNRASNATVSTGISEPTVTDTHARPKASSCLILRRTSDRLAVPVASPTTAENSTVPVGCASGETDVTSADNVTRRPSGPALLDAVKANAVGAVPTATVNDPVLTP